MDADALHKLDQIYRFFQDYPGEHKAEDICRVVFPDKPEDQAISYIRRLAADDIRFNESRSGHFTLAPKEKQSPLLKDLNYCVFDLETTGGTPPLHRIIEIGAVRIENSQIVDHFKALVQPNRPIPDYVVRLTGISDADLKGAEEIEAVLPRFMDFAKDSVLVAHNALFDVNFLNYELRRLGLGELDEAGLCTLKMSRGLLKDTVKAHKLEALAEHFDLQIEDRHRAYDDAKATAYLLLHFLKMLDSDSGPADRNSIRKYLLEPRRESLSKSLMGPEDLEDLPRSPGVVLFLDRNKRVIHGAPFKNVQRELRGMIYADMRGSSLKSVFRKATSYEVTELPNYLEAVLEAARVRVQSRGGSRNSWYLKVIDGKEGLFALTSRKYRDQALWYGPFTSMDEILRRIGGTPEAVDAKALKIPGRSSFTRVYRLKNLTKCLHQLGYSSHDADFVLAVPPGGEQSIEFLFVRGGNVVDRFLVEDFMAEDVNDILMEKVREVFVHRPKPSRKRKDPQHEQEYQALMDWLNRESRQESHCRVFRADLQTQSVEAFVGLLLVGIRDWV